VFSTSPTNKYTFQSPVSKKQVPGWQKKVLEKRKDTWICVLKLAREASSSRDVITNRLSCPKPSPRSRHVLGSASVSSKKLVVYESEAVGVGLEDWETEEEVLFEADKLWEKDSLALKEPEGDPLALKEPEGDPLALKEPEGDPLALKEELGE
jgi:hypothetical protein